MNDREEVVFDQSWDTGDLECGELLLPLQIRVGAMQPGEVILLIVRATSAAMDLRAWCRLTGHRMVKTDPPNFYIQRKRE